MFKNNTFDNFIKLNNNLYHLNVIEIEKFNFLKS